MKMTFLEKNALWACGALAVGMATALAVPRGAELWPVVLAATGLVSLWGFGFAVRGWWLLAIALLGLSLACRSQEADELRYRESPWMRLAAHRATRAESPMPIRGELSRRLEAGIGQEPEIAALNRAMLLGERQHLPRRLKRVFVDSGAVHVFAISGLHVMVVARILMFLLAAVFVPYRWQGVASLPLLWGYVFLIGTPPSAVRAALMASFYFCAPVVWRRPNGLVAWSLTFGLVHLAAPRQLAEVGSLFSFVVMLALVLCGRLVSLPRRRLGQVVFLTAVAWAAGVPIAAATFGRLTPGGLLANLVLVPAAVYSVVAGAVGLLLSFVWLPFAEHFNNLAALMTKAMVGIAAGVAALPYASVAIPAWGVAECLGWYLDLALVLYLIRRVQDRHRKI